MNTKQEEKQNTARRLKKTSKCSKNTFFFMQFLTGKRKKVAIILKHIRCFVFNHSFVFPKSDHFHWLTILKSTDFVGRLRNRVLFSNSFVSSTELYPIAVNPPPSPCVVILPPPLTRNPYPPGIEIQSVPQNLTFGEQFLMSSSILCKMALFAVYFFKKICSSNLFYFEIILTII